MFLIPSIFKLYALIALGCGVAGLHRNGPTSTRLNTHEVLGWTPKPTPGISQASLGTIELLRRQESRSYVCGYVDKDLGMLITFKTIQPYELGWITNAKTANTFTCFETTQTCVFANNGGVNCCDLTTDAMGSSSYTSCGFFTSCLNGPDLSSCSQDCLTNQYVRSW
jgi:hypothetical protein